MEAAATTICSLVAFFRSGDSSLSRLLRRAGVVDEADLPSRAAVESVLIAHPDLVDVWLRWSQDKRVSSGWYFSQTTGGFVVGYYPDGPELSFQDRVVACAEFVLRETASVAREMRANNSLQR